MKLVEDWKQAHKWLSVRIPLVSAAIAPAWLGLPDDWKSAVPRWAVLAFTFLALSTVVGRVIDQTPKDKADGT
jgi:hypothetical protein